MRTALDLTTSKGESLHPWPDRLPDLFVLGGPKCGTTSLYEWLRQHPDTYFAGKEPNFISRDVFDARAVPGAIVDWSRYLERMMPLEMSSKLTGDFTPRSLYSDLALDILADHPASPKLIIMLRNPIDLVFSLHGQMLRQGVELDADFASAWARAKSLGSDPDAWRDSEGRMDRRLDYPMYAHLGTRLQAWQGRVQPDRLKIFILEEDMTHAPDEFYAEVLSFLDLAANKVALEPKNTRVELRSVKLNRAMIALRQTIFRARAAVGLPVYHRERRGTGLMKLVNRFNQQRPADLHDSNRLAPALRAELAAELAHEIAKVELVLGRSVAGWRDWPAPLSS